MPAGFISYTDSGNIQITEELVNFGFLAKGTVTLGAAGSGGVTGMTWVSGPQATITIANTLGYPPVLGIVSPIPVAIFDVVLSGGNWVYKLVAEFGTSPGAVSIEWFAFGEVPNAVPDNYGMVVYRADGRVAFHTSYKPMRVSGFMQGSGTATSTLNTLPSGRKYAVALVQQYMLITQPFPSGTWTVFQHNSAVQSLTNGATITNKKTVETYYSAQPGWGSSITYPDWKYLVLDVNGY